jgi:hypothetical protein
MIAAQNALADGDYALAAQRLIYARDADRPTCRCCAMMTLAFWQADNLAAPRAPCATGRGSTALARRAPLRGADL